MASQDDIVRFLDQQNPGIFTPENIAFVLIVVAMTVIPLHTQNSKFLAERSYWLYFDADVVTEPVSEYGRKLTRTPRLRARLNLQNLRAIMKHESATARATELKKYLKKTNLYEFETDPPSGCKHDNWCPPKYSRDTIINPDPRSLKDDNINYSYIEVNMWWLLEYYLFMFGLLASLYILRVVINYIGNILYQSEDTTSIVLITDILSIVASIFMTYYLDVDYTNPSDKNAGFRWYYSYLSIIFLILVGQIRYLETISSWIFPIHKISLNQPESFIYAFLPIIIIVGVIMTIFWLMDYFESEKFTLNPSIISDEEEKSIQELIDEQTRSN